MTLLQERPLRLLLISSILLLMAQQLSGINAVFYYSTTFFEGVISDPLVGTNLVAFVNVVGTYIALKLMDTTARRTLILWSAGGMLISAVFIIAALKGYLANYAALIAVMAFVFFFEIGLGPVPWLIVAEMFDSKYVATAMTLACVANWSCNFLVGITFPFIQIWLGPWSFGPFSVVLIATLAFTWIALPETQGRSVADLYHLLSVHPTSSENSSDTDVKLIVHSVETYGLNDDDNIP
jgi:SP family facilitated glucose transporter-like MFS transporter 3